MTFFLRSNGHNELSASHLQQIDYQRNVIPPAMRSHTPMEMFLYRSQTAGLYKIPGMLNFFNELYVLFKLTFFPSDHLATECIFWLPVKNFGCQILIN